MVKVVKPELKYIFKLNLKILFGKSTTKKLFNDDKTHKQPLPSLRTLNESFKVTTESVLFLLYTVCTCMKAVYMSVRELDLRAYA